MAGGPFEVTEMELRWQDGGRERWTGPPEVVEVSSTLLKVVLLHLLFSSTSKKVGLEVLFLSDLIEFFFAKNETY